MKSLLFAVAASCAALVAAEPGHVVHEKRDGLHPGFAKRFQIPRGEGHVFPMRIGLVQRNMDKADDLLMDVANHDSPNYGNFYTAEEVIDLFAPARESVDAVIDWVVKSGISPEKVSLSANKQWVQFDALVEEVEHLLKTKYYAFEHLDSGRMSVACDEYHTPEDISQHVDYILPGLRLHAQGPRKTEMLKKRALGKSPIGGPVIGNPAPPAIVNASKQELLQECDTAITPVCIATMYNISQATLSHAGNQLGIFEEGDYYGKEDLILFFTTFAQNIPPATEPILHGIDGGMDLSVATGESDLDFQISYPIIYPQQSILFQTDDVIYAANFSVGDGIFNTFLDAVDGSYCKHISPIDPKYPDPNPAGYQGKLQCGVYKPTHVVSFSYGLIEAYFPVAYQTRQCHEFLKLGLQGSTIVFASGDSGVASRNAVDNNSDMCLGKGEVFAPDFPATCPYVTAVGATYLPPGASVQQDAEVAVTSFPSGGGFSNIYKRPSYQASAVSAFFATGNTTYPYYSLSKPYANPPENVTNGGYYNRVGRGYPDLSAIGDNVVIFLDGTPQLIGGTSAAAPVFAAIINRINEERLAKGKKTVGFINPVLYAHPTVFHDITVGNNSGCNTPGFYAQKGWDPLTGLGTPDYPKLLSLFMSMK